MNDLENSQGLLWNPKWCILKWTQTLAGSGGADSNGLIDCGMAIKKKRGGGVGEEKADGSPFAGAIKFHGVFSIHGFTVIQALGANFL